MQPAESKTQGQQTLEQYAQNLQINTMASAQLQLVTYLASKPPISEWPVEVRRHIYDTMLKSAQLFGPQNEEEATLYANKP